MKLWTTLLAGALALNLASCGNEVDSLPSAPQPSQQPGSVPSARPSPGVICTTQFVYGLTLRVTDPSGRPLNNATAVLRDGDYIESMQASGTQQDPTLVGAGERPGTYHLEVTAPGDLTYEEDGIVITRDPCHVIPIEKTVVLKPLLQRRYP